MGRGIFTLSYSFSVLFPSAYVIPLVFQHRSGHECVHIPHVQYRVQGYFRCGPRSVDFHECNVDGMWQSGYVDEIWGISQENGEFHVDHNRL